MLQVLMADAAPAKPNGMLPSDFNGVGEPRKDGVRGYGRAAI